MAFVDFFCPSFFFWCTFYLFSNYVFIFYREHRVLTVANIPADVHKPAHDDTGKQRNTHTHTHTHTWSHKQRKIFSLETHDTSPRCC